MTSPVHSTIDVCITLGISQYQRLLFSFIEKYALMLKNSPITPTGSMRSRPYGHHNEKNFLSNTSFSGSRVEVSTNKVRTSTAPTNNNEPNEAPLIEDARNGIIPNVMIEGKEKVEYYISLSTVCICN